MIRINENALNILTQYTCQVVEETEGQKWHRISISNHGTEEAEALAFDLFSSLRQGSTWNSRLDTDNRRLKTEQQDVFAIQRNVYLALPDDRKQHFHDDPNGQWKNGEELDPNILTMSEAADHRNTTEAIKDTREIILITCHSIGTMETIQSVQSLIDFPLQAMTEKGIKNPKVQTLYQNFLKNVPNAGISNQHPNLFENKNGIANVIQTLNELTAVRMNNWDNNAKHFNNLGEIIGRIPGYLNDDLNHSHLPTDLANNRTQYDKINQEIQNESPYLDSLDRIPNETINQNDKELIKNAFRQQSPDQLTKRLVQTYLRTINQRDEEDPILDIKTSVEFQFAPATEVLDLTGTIQNLTVQGITGRPMAEFGVGVENTQILYVNNTQPFNLTILVTPPAGSELKAAYATVWGWTGRNYARINGLGDVPLRLREEHQARTLEGTLLGLNPNDETFLLPFKKNESHYIAMPYMITVSHQERHARVDGFRSLLFFGDKKDHFAFPATADIRLTPLNRVQQTDKLHGPLDETREQICWAWESINGSLPKFKIRSVETASNQLNGDHYSVKPETKPIAGFFPSPIMVESILVPWFKRPDEEVIVTGVPSIAHAYLDAILRCKDEEARVTIKDTVYNNNISIDENGNFSLNEINYQIVVPNINNEFNRRWFWTEEAKAIQNQNEPERDLPKHLKKEFDTFLLNRKDFFECVLEIQKDRNEKSISTLWLLDGRLEGKAKEYVQSYNQLLSKALASNHADRQENGIPELCALYTLEVKENIFHPPTHPITLTHLLHLQNEIVNWEGKVSSGGDENQSTLEATLRYFREECTAAKTPHLITHSDKLYTAHTYHGESSLWRSYQPVSQSIISTLHSEGLEKTICKQIENLDKYFSPTASSQLEHADLTDPINRPLFRLAFFDIHDDAKIAIAINEYFSKWVKKNAEESYLGPRIELYFYWDEKNPSTLRQMRFLSRLSLLEASERKQSSGPFSKAKVFDLSTELDRFVDNVTFYSAPHKHSENGSFHLSFHRSPAGQSDQHVMKDHESGFVDSFYANGLAPGQASKNERRGETEYQLTTQYGTPQINSDYPLCEMVNNHNRMSEQFRNGTDPNNCGTISLSSKTLAPRDLNDIGKQSLMVCLLNTSVGFLDLDKDETNQSLIIERDFKSGILSQTHHVANVEHQVKKVLGGERAEERIQLPDGISADNYKHWRRFVEWANIVTGADAMSLLQADEIQDWKFAYIIALRYLEKYEHCFNNTQYFPLIVPLEQILFGEELNKIRKIYQNGDQTGSDDLLVFYLPKKIENDFTPKVYGRVIEIKSHQGAIVRGDACEQVELTSNFLSEFFKGFDGSNLNTLLDHASLAYRTSIFRKVILQTIDHYLNLDVGAVTTLYEAKENEETETEQTKTPQWSLRRDTIQPLMHHLNRNNLSIEFSGHQNKEKNILGDIIWMSTNTGEENHESPKTDSIDLGGYKIHLTEIQPNFAGNLLVPTKEFQLNYIPFGKKGSGTGTKISGTHHRIVQSTIPEKPLDNTAARSTSDVEEDNEDSCDASAELPLESKTQEDTAQDLDNSNDLNSSEESVEEVKAEESSADQEAVVNANSTTNAESAQTVEESNEAVDSTSAQVTPDKNAATSDQPTENLTSDEQEALNQLDCTWASLPIQKWILARQEKKEENEETTQWIQETIKLLQRGFAAFKLQAVLAKSKPILAPGALIVELEGKQGTNKKSIDKHKDELFSTYGVKILRVEIRARSLLISITRDQRSVLHYAEILPRRIFQRGKDGINRCFLIGMKEVDGQLLYLNLGKKIGDIPNHSPHTLVAGGTGSGKSVLVRNLILDYCATNSPQLASLVIIDPKRIEFTWAKRLPHLADKKVIVKKEDAINKFKALHAELNRRMELFEDAGVNTFEGYNKKAEKSEKMEKLPMFLVVHDELANWMFDSEYKEFVSADIKSLATMARSAGIHIIVVAQRPDVNVVPPQLRDNLGNRLILRVEGKGISEFALGEPGAETLLGDGHLAARMGNENGITYAQVPLLDDNDGDEDSDLNAYVQAIADSWP